MKAWRVHAFGPPDSMAFEDVADPPLDSGEVRIAVAACAVNFPDAMLVAGTFQITPALPFTPGFVVAGVVAESRDPAVPVGTRVASTLNGYSGGYSTHSVTAGSRCATLSDHTPATDAAALGLTYQTCWIGLHRRARLQPGEWLLVHAGAGGIGSAAIQLGAAAGARVIATAGGRDKVELCRTLGAEVAIDYTTADFAGQVNEITAGHGADVILDSVGGDVLHRSTKCVAFEGRILVVGFSSGQPFPLRANHMLVKNYTVAGLYWGTYISARPDALVSAQQEIDSLYQDKRIAPVVSDCRPLTDAPAAMKSVSSRATVGRVLLIP
ncbi:MAG: NADPH:quinone oxidoreductase family protein [Mycobacteriaceae bacterium]|nr:NADPH:quinone oxidoreductase family protein [Mycobacteriaceae bacterium]